MKTSSIILLVDDDRMNLSVTVILFKRLGIKIDTAGNGREALNMHQTGNYDLILMDLNMPEMDGLTASREIRKLEGDLQDVKIVAMTGYDSESEMTKCKQAGMNDYISKPYNLDYLLQVINLNPQVNCA